jgi:hypothetical protein
MPRDGHDVPTMKYDGKQVRSFPQSPAPLRRSLASLAGLVEAYAWVSLSFQDWRGRTFRGGSERHFRLLLLGPLGKLQHRRSLLRLAARDELDVDREGVEFL